MPTVTSEQKETARAEAFSDGVFAFAMTLLVLNLKDPLLDPFSSHGSLWDGLLAQWPALFALVTSFATILIMWVNHHNMFTQIRRINTTVLFLNGLLLFFVVLTPFTTLLVADHVSLNQTGDGRTAAALYSGSFLVLALVWTLIWRYSAKRGFIVSRRTRGRDIIGPVSYGVALGLAFVNGLASLVVIVLVAAYFTIAATDFWRADQNDGT